MKLETAIEEIVAQKVEEILHHEGLLATYHRLSVAEAAEMVGVSKSIIQELVNNHKKNGFPGAKLGPKTFVIDRIGLIRWLNEGGLLRAESNNCGDEERQVSD